MSDEKLTRTERVLVMIPMLSGYEMTGRRVGELAEELGTSSANVSRDLEIMIGMEVVERMPDDKERYRLGPSIVQVAIRHMDHMDQAARKLETTRRRFQG